MSQHIRSQLLKDTGILIPGIQDHEITPQQAEEKFRNLFETSVTRRLRSDVAVGSSLSGGLDSSIVVWQIDNIYKGLGSGVQKTFSARFPGYAKDEGRFMQMIIDQTNADPYFVYPDGKKMADNIDKLFFHQEEPFLSASIYAQYCVMKLAKQNNVTVLLDGQGADEVLAGYHSYYMEFFKELKKIILHFIKMNIHHIRICRIQILLINLLKKTLNFY